MFALCFTIAVLCIKDLLNKNVFITRSYLIVKEIYAKKRKLRLKVSFMHRNKSIFLA